ncbi:DUF4365 and DUF1817 domain-containing protein [Mucilaginibacter sp. CAU 1740]|uniref:DUF4365 domain-containing protein n=1 Tax=Mucilaginibacter sp. CAU 1740 TaxID=3140365 RepID=UPI00325B042B
MPENSFPKYVSNRKTGDNGVSFVKSIVETDFDWLFRPVHLEDDFGLDGYFDVLVGESVTGKFLGVQIKTGDSYFASATSTGWTFTGENKHLNYYLNAGFPVLIIIVNLSDRKAYWTRFDINNIDRTKNGWSINIPKANLLDKGFKQKFIEYAGGVVDYMDQIEYQWEINKKLRESGLIYLEVNKSEILNKDVSGFVKLLDRLTINDRMIEKTRGKISFAIDGYNHDPREVYEIPAIKEWVRVVLPAFKYWGYFLNMEEFIENVAGLRVLHLCYANAHSVTFDRKTNIKQVSTDTALTLEFLEKIFDWLNEFSETYKISEDINKEQSDLIVGILTGKK